MVRYWKMMAGRGGKASDYFFKNNIIAIYWSNIKRCLIGCNKNEIFSELKLAYPNRDSRFTRRQSSEINSFLNEMSVGDRVVIKDMKNKTLRIGEIASQTECAEPPICPVKYLDGIHFARHVRKVEWLGEADIKRIKSESHSTYNALHMRQQTCLEIKNEAIIEELSGIFDK